MLAVNAILHGAIVARFGVKGNEPPLAFGAAYAALALAVLFAVPYALWAALILPLVGIAGLAVAYNRIPHEKTIERVILALNGAIILFVGNLLFTT